MDPSPDLPPVRPSLHPTKETEVSEKKATIEKGDLVLFVDEFGDEHEADVRAVVQDESLDGPVARLEVEPGVIVWVPVNDFESIEEG